MPKLDLPDTFIVFDMEWTAWEGSLERDWSGPDEYREIYDIGAVKVSGDNFEVDNTYQQRITLELVPKMPAYSVKLTGLTQADLDRDGIPFKDMVAEFKKFTGDLLIYAWGIDGERLAENCQLKKVINPFPADQFRNMRELFKKYGIPADDYYSSTILEYFGQHNKHHAHQGLDDALNIVEALRLLSSK